MAPLEAATSSNKDGFLVLMAGRQPDWFHALCSAPPWRPVQGLSQVISYAPAADPATGATFSLSAPRLPWTVAHTVLPASRPGSKEVDPRGNVQAAQPTSAQAPASTAQEQATQELQQGGPIGDPGPIKSLRNVLEGPRTRVQQLQHLRRQQAVQANAAASVLDGYDSVAHLRGNCVNTAWMAANVDCSSSGRNSAQMYVHARTRVPSSSSDGSGSPACFLSQAQQVLQDCTQMLVRLRSARSNSSGDSSGSNRGSGDGSTNNVAAGAAAAAESITTQSQSDDPAPQEQQDMPVQHDEQQQEQEQEQVQLEEDVAAVSPQPLLLMPPVEAQFEPQAGTECSIAPAQPSCTDHDADSCIAALDDHCIDHCDGGSRQATPDDAAACLEIDDPGDDSVQDLAHGLVLEENCHGLAHEENCHRLQTQPQDDICMEVHIADVAEPEQQVLADTSGHDQSQAEHALDAHDSSSSIDSSSPDSSSEVKEADSGSHAEPGWLCPPGMAEVLGSCQPDQQGSTDMWNLDQAAKLSSTRLPSLSPPLNQAASGLGVALPFWRPPQTSVTVALRSGGSVRRRERLVAAANMAAAAAEAAAAAAKVLQRSRLETGSHSFGSSSSPLPRVASNNGPVRSLFNQARHLSFNQSAGASQPPPPPPPSKQQLLTSLSSVWERSSAPAATPKPYEPAPEPEPACSSGVLASAWRPLVPTHSQHGMLWRPVTKAVTRSRSVTLRSIQPEDLIGAGPTDLPVSGGAGVLASLPVSSTAAYCSLIQGKRSSLDSGGAVLQKANVASPRCAWNLAGSRSLGQP